MQLPQSVINSISAGEVIYQPVNVVKELLENALDAGSTRIVVNLENGGFSRISVGDNGCGIASTDLCLACRRHATSKLREFGDLMKITTFGFRGEALFSMSCVAHVAITSKVPECDFGYKARYQDGEMNQELECIVGVDGTTVDVTDLFYNRPMKLRALPDAMAQNRNVLQMATQYAIACPNVSIIVNVDGKERLHTTGGTTTEAVIALIYGADALSVVFRVDCNLGFNTDATLFLGTVAAKRYLKGSSVFVNGRLVRCDKVRKTIEGVYSEFLMKGDKPFFLAMLTIRPDKVDVNVHPTKRDVTFENSEQILDNLAVVLRENLQSHCETREFKAVSSQRPLKGTRPSPGSQQAEVSMQRQRDPHMNITGLVESQVVTRPVDIPEEKELDLLTAEQEELGDDVNVLPQEREDFHRENPIPVKSPPVRVDIPCMVVQAKPRDVPPVQKIRNQPEIFSKPKRKIERLSLFEELKYEPKDSKEVRVDYRDRTIEEMLAISATKIEGEVPEFRTMDVAAIEELKQQIIREADPVLCDIFHHLTCVGPIDLTQVAFSSGSKLYICSLFDITKLLFYQLFIQRFGNMGWIEFGIPIDITQMASYCPHGDIDVAVKLEQHRDLLSDYFSIVIEHGSLRAMPNVLPGYQPSFMTLPLFLVRLATEINFDYEYDCVLGIVTELAMLYSIIPEDSKSPETEQRLQAELKNVILPAMKSDFFLPTARLATEGSVTEVASRAEMFTIFERS